MGYSHLEKCDELKPKIGLFYEYFFLFQKPIEIGDSMYYYHDAQFQIFLNGLSYFTPC